MRWYSATPIASRNSRGLHGMPRARYGPAHRARPPMNQPRGRGGRRRNAGRRKAARPSLVYCGDDKSGKAVAAELIRDVGFDPVDAGPLRIARYIEPFALLVAQLAYEGEGGPELAYRFERFGRKG